MASTPMGWSCGARWRTNTARLVVLRTFVPQIGGQRLAGGRRQRQDVLAARLRALERDGAGAPVDVGQLELGDLAAAQPQVQRQRTMA